MKKQSRSHGIALKKKYGQHFLRDQHVVDTMLENVVLTNTTSVFEIGCGDGFLTRSILQHDIARLWIFEIDPDWVAHISKTIQDERLTVHEENFLDTQVEYLEPHAPWTVLSNLPYQVTFPILTCFVKMRHLITEGVVMVQEEVAQKLLKTGGRGYGFISLFFQYYFEWKKLIKIPPGAFFPPPKVDSRLLHFKPRATLQEIPDIDEFWKFIKVAFRQPRRTLRNNLSQAHFPVDEISSDTLSKRGQELSMDDFITLWKVVHRP